MDRASAIGSSASGVLSHHEVKKEERDPESLEVKHHPGRCFYFCHGFGQGFYDHAKSLVGYLGRVVDTAKQPEIKTPLLDSRERAGVDLPGVVEASTVCADAVDLPLSRDYVAIDIEALAKIAQERVLEGHQDDATASISKLSKICLDKSPEEILKDPSLVAEMMQEFMAIDRHANSWDIRDKNYLHLFVETFRFITSSLQTFKFLTHLIINGLYYSGYKDCKKELPDWRQRYFERAIPPEDLDKVREDLMRAYENTIAGADLGVEAGIVTGYLIMDQVHRSGASESSKFEWALGVSFLAYVLMPIFSVIGFRTKQVVVNKMDTKRIDRWHKFVDDLSHTSFTQKYNRIRFGTNIMNFMMCKDSETGIDSGPSLWQMIWDMVHAINFQPTTSTCVEKGDVEEGEIIETVVLDRLREIDNIAKIAREDKGMLSGIAMFALAEIERSQTGETPKSLELRVRAKHQLDTIIEENRAKPEKERNQWVEDFGIIAKRDIGASIPHTTAKQYFLQNIYYLLQLMPYAISTTVGCGNLISNIQWMIDHNGRPW